MLFGTMGEILTEKSGNLNLGVPGIMYLGGFAGLASAFYYEQPTAGPQRRPGVVIALLCAFLASTPGRPDLQLSSPSPCGPTRTSPVWP